MTRQKESDSSPPEGNEGRVASNALTPGNALELYKVFKDAEIRWLYLHRRDLQLYVLFVAAVLTATVGTFCTVYPQHAELTLFLLVGPLLSIALCVIGRVMCNRANQRFLEAVTVQVKLEPLFGLSQARPEVVAANTQEMFPMDRSFLPGRWLESRKCANTADEFVTRAKTGHSNGLAHKVFALLFWSNVAVATIIVALGVLALCGITLHAS
jgi:hypothetical protein